MDSTKIKLLNTMVVIHTGPIFWTIGEKFINSTNLNPSCKQKFTVFLAVFRFLAYLKEFKLLYLLHSHQTKNS